MDPNHWTKQDAARQLEQYFRVFDLARQFNRQSDLFEDAVHTTRKGSEQVARAVAGILTEQLDKQMM